MSPSYRSALVALLALAMLATASNVVDLTPKNFDAVIDGSKHALIEFYAPWCGHCKQLAPTYEELADAYKHAKNELVIAKVDADAHRALGEKFGVQGFPTLKWFSKGNSKTPEDYSSGRALEDFTKFIEDKTSLRAKIHKAPSHVTVLTTDTFDDIVMDAKKNVLVEFYAPWCGHCKALAPTWDKLASTFSTEEDVVIANVDATAHPEIGTRFNVEGYPTIKFFPAGSKQKVPVPYEGARSEADFVSFINERAGTHRVAGGGLDEDAGIVSELADAVTAFVAAPAGEKRTTALNAARKEVQTLQGRDAKSGALYVKIMERIVKAGDAYIDKEHKRLSNLLEQDNVQQKNRDLFATRRNILGEFAAALKSKGRQEL